MFLLLKFIERPRYEAFRTTEKRADRRMSARKKTSAAQGIRREAPHGKTGVNSRARNAVR